MASITTLREELAANLTSIPGLQQSPYVLASPTPPCAEVIPAEISFDTAFSRGIDGFRFTVRVLVGNVTDIGAQKRLDGFLAGSGPQSIKEAIEADPRLGGHCEDLRVESCGGYRVFDRGGGAPLLGAEWVVAVFAGGGP